MKPLHKAVLRNQTMLLVKGLVLSSKLFAELYQRRVIDEGQVEEIESQRTNTDRVYTLLQILPKRGSDAFDTLVSILDKDYPYIAARLREECENLSKNFVSTDATDIANGNPVPKSELAEMERQIESRGLAFRTRVDIPSLEDVYKLAAFKVQTLMGRKANLRPRQQTALTQWLTHQIYQAQATEATRTQGTSADTNATNGSGWTLPCRQCRVKESQLQQKVFSVYLKAVFKLTGEVEVQDEDSAFRPGLLLSDMNLKVVEGMVVHLIDVIDVTKEKLELCQDFLRDRYTGTQGLPLEAMVKVAVQQQEAMEAENRRLKAQLEALKKKHEGNLSQEDWQRRVDALQSKQAELTASKTHLKLEAERLTRENATLTAQGAALTEARLQLQDKQHTIEKLRTRVAQMEVELRGRRRSFQLAGGPMIAADHAHLDQPHPPAAETTSSTAAVRERRTNPSASTTYVPKRRKVKKGKKKKSSAH